MPTTTSKSIARPGAVRDLYAVPAPGAPHFQAATANLDPWTEVQVDTDDPDRGPMLII